MSDNRPYDMIRILKTTQLALALGVVALAWLVYPGAMAIAASLVALPYVFAAAFAFRGKRFATVSAFLFSLVTLVLTALAVGRFAASGFDFLAARFTGYEQTYLLPYAFLAIAGLALVVVVLHVVAWRRDR